MKKKKILLAVLASLCVAAGAAGITACSGGGGEAHDPALYAAYQTYATETENPKTYEEWVADLLARLGAGGSQGSEGPQGERGDDGEDGIDGEDGVGIDDVKMVEIEGKQYFEFRFSNGKIVRLAVDGTDRQETSSFTVTAVDNNGEPVADAYFNVGFTENYNRRLTKDGTATDNEREYFAAKTNAKGIATFYTFPEEYAAGYSVYLASPYSISSNGRTPAVPAGYAVDFGTSHGLNNTSAPFTQGEDGNYTVTVNFKIDNSWDSIGSDSLTYSRYATDPLNSDNITEINEPYVKRVQKGKYNYLSFSPYNVNVPGGDIPDETMDKIIEKARNAASGIYRFSFRAGNSSANVQLYAYDFTNGSYYVKNDDGSPADSLILQRSGSVPADGETLQAAYQRYKTAEGNGALSYNEWLAEYSATFTGGNYVDLHVEQDEASAVFCLGFVADINCDITVTVERTGEVTKWSNTYSKAGMPANEKHAMENDGRMIDVPLDSVIVRDDKGGYHLDSTTGPEIYVQLNNPTRANQNSMIQLADYSTPELEHASVFNYYTETVNEAANTGVRAYTDYTDVVKGYSALANGNGGYPVNDLLKTVLENFCRGFMGWSNYDEYWVAACYYYGAPSDGSEASPYDLTAGTNSVGLHSSGTTHLSFKPSDSNYYTVSSSAGTLNIDGGIVIDGTVYVYVQSSRGIEFTLAGSGNATVTIGTVAANRVIEYSVSDSQNPDGTFTETVSGTAENPVKRSGINVFRVNIDHSAYGGKVAVDWTAAPGGTGTYSITVYGSSTATVETGEAGSYTSVLGTTLTFSDTVPTRLWFDDTAGGTFFIKVTKLS